MDNNYIITSNGCFISDAELYHSLFKNVNRNTNKQFKYIAKITIGKNVRYFYDKHEYEVYLKNKNNNNNKPVQITNDPKQYAETKKIGKAFADKVVNTYSSRPVQIPKDFKQHTETKKIGKAFVDKVISAKANLQFTAVNIDKTKTDKSPKMELFDDTKVSNADMKSIMLSPKTWNELKHKDHAYTKAEDQSAVNPKWPSKEKQAEMNEKEYEKVMPYMMNCANCTLAYDVRQRGYDVQAAPYDPNETFHPSIENVSKWYKGVTKDDWDHFSLPEKPKLDKKFEEYSKEEQAEILKDLEPANRGRAMMAKVYNTIQEFPDNSYGQFCVWWSTGSGHSVVWEKENSKITIRDCQSNTSFDFSELIRERDETTSKESFAYAYDVTDVYILRTDDKELTNEALRRIRSVR